MQHTWGGYLAEIGFILKDPQEEFKPKHIYITPFNPATKTALNCMCKSEMCCHILTKSQYGVKKCTT